MSNETKRPVKSAETALRVIEALGDLDGARVNALSNHLDLPESTVHNYLKTLEHNEYVVKTDGEYRVGLRFLYQGERARARRDIYEIAKPELKELAAETGELVNLLVEEHGRGVYIYRTKGSQTTSQHSYLGGHVGERVYLHATASGKAILAQLSEEIVDEITERHGLPAMTDDTLQDRDALMEELRTIRKEGVAHEDEEYIAGLRAVAAPVTRNDEPLGAISVSGPLGHMDDSRFNEKLPNVITNVANVIDFDVTFS